MTDESRIFLSPQQEKFTDSKDPLRAYLFFSAGSVSLFNALMLEFYRFFIAPLPGGLGLAVRRILSPFLFANNPKGVSIASGVDIRVPHRISIGYSSIVDADVVLDVREEGQRGSIVLGEKCLIGRGSIIAAKGGEITFGEGVNIGSQCRIATQSRVCIGKGVLIAAYSYIGPGNHNVVGKNEPIISQDMEGGKGVEIGDYAWIGARATVLDGAKIGSHAVIGAHSLVTEDVAEGAIVGGIPAKLIRMRDD